MKYIIIFVFAIITLSSCYKDELTSDCLFSGAWSFSKVEINDRDVLLDGMGDPHLLFFFLPSKKLKGSFEGEFEYNMESHHMFLKAEIDTTQEVFGGEKDLLDYFPQRYYDLEEILKDGIDGSVMFIENGWDSRFSIQYEENKKIWFEKY